MKLRLDADHAAGKELCVEDYPENRNCDGEEYTDQEAGNFHPVDLFDGLEYHSAKYINIRFLWKSPFRGIIFWLLNRGIYGLFEVLGFIRHSRAYGR